MNNSRGATLEVALVQDKPKAPVAVGRELISTDGMETRRRVVVEGRGGGGFAGCLFMCSSPRERGFILYLYLKGKGGDAGIKELHGSVMWGLHCWRLSENPPRAEEGSVYLISFFIYCMSLWTEGGGSTLRGPRLLGWKVQRLTIESQEAHLCVIGIMNALGPAF